MYTNEELIKLLEQQKKQDLKYPYLGIKLRMRRRELGMTQEKVCIGICTSSYLSKLENDKYDLAYMFLPNILKKLGLTIEEVSLDHYYDYFKQLLEAYVIDDYETINTICDLCRDKKDFHFTLLIKYFEATVNKKPQQALKEFEKIRKYKNKLGYEGLRFFLLTEIIFHLNFGTIKTVEKIYLAIVRNLISFEEYKYAFEFIRYEYAKRICDIYSAKCALTNLRDFYDRVRKFETYSIKNKEIELRSKMAGFLDRGFEFTGNDLIVSNISDMIHKNKLGLIRYINSLGDSEFEVFIKIVSYSFYNIDNPAYFDMYEYEGFKKDVVDGIIIKFKEGVDAYKSYILNELLPKYIKHGDILIIRYIKEAFGQLCFKTSRYKEIALQFLWKKDENID